MALGSDYECHHELRQQLEAQTNLQEMGITAENFGDAQVLHHHHRCEVHEGYVWLVLIFLPKSPGRIKSDRRYSFQLVTSSLDRLEYINHELPGFGEIENSEQRSHEFAENVVGGYVTNFLPLKKPVLLNGRAMVWIIFVSQSQPGPSIHKNHCSCPDEGLMP